jgi:hypothetical protein
MTIDIPLGINNIIVFSSSGKNLPWRDFCRVYPGMLLLPSRRESIYPPAHGAVFFEPAIDRLDIIMQHTGIPICHTISTTPRQVYA